MIADQLVLTPIEPREHPWTPDPDSPAFCRLCDEPRKAHPEASSA